PFTGECPHPTALYTVPRPSLRPGSSGRRPLPGVPDHVHGADPGSPQDRFPRGSQGTMERVRVCPARLPAVAPGIPEPFRPARGGFPFVLGRQTSPPLPRGAVG